MFNFFFFWVGKLLGNVSCFGVVRVLNDRNCVFPRGSMISRSSSGTSGIEPWLPSKPAVLFLIISHTACFKISYVCMHICVHDITMNLRFSIQYHTV